MISGVAHGSRFAVVGAPLGSPSVVFSVRVLHFVVCFPFSLHLPFVQLRHSLLPLFRTNFSLKPFSRIDRP